MEVWKDIQGYEGIYQVSNMGRVKRLVGYQCKKERILCGRLDKDGYRCVVLHKDGKEKNNKLHRMVAKAFIPNPENKNTVNHIDCNKDNNVVENLEWATDKEQMAHAKKNNRLVYTEFQKKQTQLALNKPVRQYTKDGEFVMEYSSMGHAAESMGGSRTNIHHACYGEQKTAYGFVWKFV